MTSKQITAPAVLPVTLAGAKEHLRISSDVEDDLVSSLIASATALTERETGLAMITQSWRLWLDGLPQDGIVRLPRNPVQRITNVIWYDAQGTAHDIAGNAYFLNMVARPARLRFDRAQCPTGLCNGIEIDFDAGFGDLGADTPDMLRRAILSLVSHWYEFRGVYSASDQPVSVPEIYTRLTRHYRSVRI